MKIRMTQSLVGDNFSLAVGEEPDFFSVIEKKRLVKAGLAEECDTTAEDERATLTDALAQLRAELADEKIAGAVSMDALKEVSGERDALRREVADAKETCDQLSAENVRLLARVAELEVAAKAGVAVQPKVSAKPVKGAGD